MKGKRNNKNKKESSPANEKDCMILIKAIVAKRKREREIVTT